MQGSDDEVGAAYLRDKDGADIEQPCEAFIFAAAPAPDVRAFRAANNSSLVFDGRLVIDNHFATNDPSILAVRGCAAPAPD